MYEAVVFLTEDFEEIEAITAIDILRRGDVNTVTVSLTDSHEVKGARDIFVTADSIFGGISDYTNAMLILPGGPGTQNYKTNEKFLELLCNHNNKGGRIAAICAAPTVLGMLDFLKDKEAVCYTGMESQLNAAKISEKSTVTDGNITTSKGVGSALEFALELVRIIKGDEKAAAVAKAVLFKE